MILQNGVLGCPLNSTVEKNKDEHPFPRRSTVSHPQPFILSILRNTLMYDTLFSPVIDMLHYIIVLFVKGSNVFL